MQRLLITFIPIHMGLVVCIPRLKTFIAGIGLWKRITVFSSYYGRRVDAKTSVAAQIVAGVVDWQLGSVTVRANDLFWLCVGCRTKAKLANDDTEAANTEGDVVIASGTTAGCWYGYTGADSIATKQIINAIGRVPVTTTAANKNTLQWIDLYRLY